MKFHHYNVVKSWNLLMMDESSNILNEINGGCIYLYTTFNFYEKMAEDSADSQISRPDPYSCISFILR